jgi:hypothetical protein
MSVLSNTAKGAAGFKAAKGAAKNPTVLRAGAKAAPPAAKLGWKFAKPRLKRTTRRKAERFGDVLGTTLTVYGPQAARQLGLAEPPKPKRTAPRIVLGILIGATAVYFLEPEHGAQHREQVLKLVG